MPVTFVGAQSSPIDGGTSQSTSVTGLALPSGTQVGDFIFVFVSIKGTFGSGSATLPSAYPIGTSNFAGSGWQIPAYFGTSVDRIGSGQAVDSTLLYTQAVSSTGASINISANFSGGGNTNTSFQVLVFRPTSPQYKLKPLSSIWQYNVGASTTYTSSGVSGLPVNSFAIAMFNSSDDNTWGTLTGTGWSKTGLTAQYRNLGGSDSSTTYAYAFFPSGGTSNSVSQTQLTLGFDAGYVMGYYFQEYLDTNQSDFINFF